MSDRDDLSDLEGDRIATTEASEEGFYWVILGRNPPEIAYWKRGATATDWPWRTVTSAGTHLGGNLAG
jgi:hypothetical protein